MLFGLAGGTGQERTFTLCFLLEKFKRELFACVCINQVTVYTRCSFTHSHNALSFQAFSVAVVQTIDFTLLNSVGETWSVTLREERKLRVCENRTWC